MNGFLRCVWGLGDGGGCSTEKREIVGGREMEKKNKIKKKPTTLGDLQRLIAWLFLGLGFDLHRDAGIGRVRAVLPWTQTPPLQQSCCSGTPLHPLPVQPTIDETNRPLLPF